MCIRTYVCKCVYMCVCVCMCMCEYACVYLHACVVCLLALHVHFIGELITWKFLYNYYTYVHVYLCNGRTSKLHCKNPYVFVTGTSYQLKCLYHM